MNGSIESVANILLDSASLPLWWPQFLESEVIEPGGEYAVGRLVRVVTRSWLPYKLRFKFRVTEVKYPTWFRLRSEGDFVGVGEGSLTSTGISTTVDFNWNIHVEKRLLFYGSCLLKPLFIHNHQWLMRRGQDCCQARIDSLAREQSHG